MALSRHLLEKNRTNDEAVEPKRWGCTVSRPPLCGPHGGDEAFASS